MKIMTLIAALAFAPGFVLAAEKPDWAFPVTEKDQPAPRIAGDKVRTIGKVSIARSAADDMYNVPDWRLTLHPPMPKIVQFGNAATQRYVYTTLLNHLHEHLGQSIAYARMNGVTPPWSK